MSRIRDRHGRSQRHHQLRRLIWIGPATIAASVLAVSIVRALIVALMPLDSWPGSIMASHEPEVATGVLVTAAVVLFPIIVTVADDRSWNVSRTFRRVALCVLTNPMVQGPGRGWVAVRAPRLEAGALRVALERGDFYASTGVVLDEVTPTERSLAVKVRAQGDSKYRVQFIGRGGQVLSEANELSAYTFKGTEGYVRAKVLESNGRVAWVQPVVVPGRSSAFMGWAAPILIAGLIAYRRRRSWEPDREIVSKVAGASEPSSSPQ